MIGINETSQIKGKAAVWRMRMVILSLLLFFFSIPHTLEDFALGQPAKNGIPAPLLAFLIAALVALQALGLFWAGRQERRSAFIHAGLGLAWALAAGFEQLPVILTSDSYRSGFISILYVAGMILIGILLFLVSLQALRTGSGRTQGRVNMPGSTSPDVLIVGGGPTGLTAASEAIRHGLSVRVVDQNDSRSIHSKALVVHSRTLEIFQDMGLASCVLNSGRKFDALNIHTPDRRLARIVFEELDWQDAVFPFWLSIPQSETERCLEKHLNELGGGVERGTELLDLEQFPDFARVKLKHPDDRSRQ